MSLYHLSDLDHTILCSISPIPTDIIPKDNEQTSKCPVAPSNLLSLLPSAPKLQFFHQIDDDFPYNKETLDPNTITYIRPGAQMALKLCNKFGVIHVYTAAQGSYTNNILNVLDPNRTLFTEVLHRCDYPQILDVGKDLEIATKDIHRAILFDDRISNFKPQNYQNGVVVVPFNANKVAKCNEGSWVAYLQEVKEMTRLVGIAFWSHVHYSGDVRNVVGQKENDATTSKP